MTNPDCSVAKYLSGKEVFTDPVVPHKLPVLAVNDYVPCTDEFRASFNQWLLDLFGERLVIICMGEMVFIHPRTWEQVRHDVELLNTPIYSSHLH